MSTSPSAGAEVPKEFAWLADAPLFIDGLQVERFYDAVVRPDGDTGKTILTFVEGQTSTTGGKVAAETGFSLSNLLPSFSFKGSAEAGHEQGKSEENQLEVELQPIKNPQRQLIQLGLHYLSNLPSRLYLVHNSSEAEWRSPETIADLPRELVFLNLPGQVEAAELGLPETKLIPAAAEFEGGHIDLLYKRLKSRDGTTSPEYPDRAESLDALRTQRRTYWSWFDQNFSATQAMLAVEAAAAEHGRIRWIDYRVPLTKDGDTLHLHVVPSGLYDTGVFAYNFIKRGYKHGLRLVGTLKSEPDMNVLAIYDK